MKFGKTRCDYIRIDLGNIEASISSPIPFKRV